MKHAFFICLALISTSALCQKLSKEQATEDLNFLVESIQNYNPALNDYNSNFTSHAQSVIHGVQDSLSILDYFKLVSQIASLSNEGHFNLGTWEDQAHKGFLENVYKYLPFSIKIISGKMYVWSDFSVENELTRGDEILSINNMPPSEILDSLALYIPSDGEIRTYFERKAEIGFPWMYYLYIEQPADFELHLKKYETGEEATTRIKALTVTERNKLYKERYPQTIKDTDISEFYEFSMADNYAVLTLKSFDYQLVEKYDIKPGKLYEELFGKLNQQKIPNLIIDLRNNTGGRNEFADDMIPFLPQTHTDDLMKTTISWKGKEKQYKFPKKDKLAFSGNVFCLVNGETYSAGATLARYLKEYADATIIGEETGTRYAGFAAGSSETIYLPNTLIKIGIPRYHILFPPSVKQTTKNKGLLPDKPVEHSIQDFIEEKDKEMEVALNLIQ